MVYIATASSLLMACAAVAGAIIAGIGLNTWKSQISWQSDHTLARDILKLLYRHRDAVAAVRHPAIFTGEIAAAMEGRDDTEEPREKERFRQTVAVYEKRWEKVSEIRSELYPLVLEADVLWGSDSHDLVKPIIQLETELRIAINTYLRASDPDEPDAGRKAANDYQKKRRDIMYDSLDDDDEFRRNHEEALTPIEDFLRGKLGRRS